MTTTFTKKAVKWMLIVGSINAMIPFVLSAFGKEPVRELGIAWVTEIVAVIVGYLVKSFRENKEAAKQRHEDLVAGISEGYRPYRVVGEDDESTEDINDDKETEEEVQ